MRCVYCKSRWSNGSAKLLPVREHVSCWMMVVNTYSLSNLEKQKKELDATPEATKLTETACPEVSMSEVRHKSTSLTRANQSPGAYLSPARLCLRGENGNSP